MFSFNDSNVLLFKIIKGGFIEVSYDIGEAFKELNALKFDGVISIQSIHHWLNLCRCLLPDCNEFIKLYQSDCVCQYLDCVCKLTCTCGKCAYCDVQKFQDLYAKFSLLTEFHSYSECCKEAIEGYKNYGLDGNVRYWRQKYSKLIDKMALFHYHFDKDFDTPDHEGFEGRVFVDDEIEVDKKDFKGILEFLELYESTVYLI